MAQRKNETHTKYLERCRAYNNARYADPVLKGILKSRSQEFLHIHREEINAKRRTPEHRQKAREQKRLLYATDQDYREKAKDLSRQGNQKYKEQNRKRIQQRKKDDPETLAQLDRKRGCRYRLNVRQQILRAYGSKCVCCGETIERLLAIDHINGRGIQDFDSKGRKIAGPRFYSWLRSHDYPPGYQVLCHNCNFAKGHYDHCPHSGSVDEGKPLSKWKKYSRVLRGEVFAHYGSHCQCCGESILEFLSIDHINGNGKEHRTINGKRLNGTALYSWLKRQGYPEGFQLLCHNCNLAKGIYGSCPHNPTN